MYMLRCLAIDQLFGASPDAKSHVGCYFWLGLEQRPSIYHANPPEQLRGADAERGVVVVARR